MMVEKKRVLRMMNRVIRKAVRTVTFKHNFRDVSITECTEILLESINKIAREHATILETTGEEPNLEYDEAMENDEVIDSLDNDEVIDSLDNDEVMEKQECSEVMEKQECGEVMEKQATENDELINKLIEELGKEPSYQQYDELMDVIDEAIKKLDKEDEVTQDMLMQDQVLEESDVDQNFPDFETLMEMALDNTLIQINTFQNLLR